jgi:hypothetical protein
MDTTSTMKNPLQVLQKRAFQRLGAVCALGGSLLNWVANLLHPKEFVAYDSAAHLQTIAADRTWSVVHFLFLVVAALTLVGLVALSDSLLKTPGGGLARLAAKLAVIGTAIMAIFFVVDGYGMKAAAEIWLNAPPGETAPALYAALLMSKLGIASGSAYQFWYLGLLPLAFAAAILRSGSLPVWQGYLAALSGLLGVAAGASFFLAGYTSVGLMAFIGAQTIFAVWVFAAGFVLYRSAGA